MSRNGLAGKTKNDFLEVLPRMQSTHGRKVKPRQTNLGRDLVEEKILREHEDRYKTIYENTMDITSQDRVNETIKTLINAIEHGPSSIVITNAEGKIEFINTKFTTTTQYSLEDVRGKNPRVFNPGHLPEREFENLWAILRKGNVWKGEIQNRRKDGFQFWEEITISSLIDPSGKVTNYILIHNDITEKRQMLNDLIAAKEKAEESDRLKSAFLANMSHEIRTPMNIIMGFAEQLGDPDLSHEEREDYISIIQESGKGLLNIFNDIVSISKVEAGQMPVSVSEINVNELIEQIYYSFKDQAEQKGINILYNNGLNRQEAFISADKEKVSVILNNLVKNAIKFTSTGLIETGYQKRDNFLEFYVKDTGVGIPRELQEIIFEPFRQGSESLRRNYGGMGLGLSISKAYVEILGGQIRVESQLGKGSKFYFTLPWKSQTQPVFWKDDEPGNQGDLLPNKLKILIVEDNEYSAQLLGKVVKQNSRGTLFAKTGMRAVEMCRINPDIDLVMMDIQLPEMNGIEATKQIRKFNKEVIIIAQTAFVLTHTREDAVEAGCNDYISKPIDQALLRKLIREYFEKS